MVAVPAEARVLSSSSSRIVSFVLRPVQDATYAAPSSGPLVHWRGVIRYVQGEEISFSCFADALAFMSHHVCLEQPFPGDSPSPTRTIE